MGTDTKIEWADHSWSPWMGCQKVHTGCEHCYAKRQTARLGVKWGPDGTRVKTSEAYWKKPLTWNKKAEAEAEGIRRTVFPSMCDPFEDWQGPIVNAKGARLLVDTGTYTVDLTMDDLRRDMFGLFDQTTWLDLILLTKRPENIRRFWPPRTGPCTPRGKMNAYRENVHLLYSASDQETLEAGIGHLLKCRDLVPVLGLSLEPLVGPIDLSAYISPCEGCGNQGSLAFEGAEAGNSLCLDACTQHGDDRSKLNWVIVGGESGPNARPCKSGWIRDIRDQCEAAGIPLFIKQLGANSTGWDYDDFGVALSDGNDGFAVAEFHDPKGGDWDEWPEPLKVRQSPEVKS